MSSRIRRTSGGLVRPSFVRGCEALNEFVPQIHPDDVAAYQRVADVWMELP